MTSTVYRPPFTIAFSNRELDLLREAVTMRALDQMNMRELCRKVGHEHDEAHYAEQVEALDALRSKLGLSKDVEIVK